MFILSNIYDIPHSKQFPAVAGQSPAIFDLSEDQMSWEVNADWHRIQNGDVVCVVSSDRCFTTLYVVREKSQDEMSKASVLRGEIVAKPTDDRVYTTVLNANRVRCARLPDNSFYQRFNVADLGAGMDKATARINKRIPELAGARGQFMSIKELKRALKA